MPTMYESDFPELKGRRFMTEKDVDNEEQSILHERKQQQNAQPSTEALDAIARMGGALSRMKAAEAEPDDWSKGLPVAALQRIGEGQVLSLDSPIMNDLAVKRATGSRQVGSSSIAAGRAQGAAGKIASRKAAQSARMTAQVGPGGLAEDESDMVNIHYNKIIGVKGDTILLDNGHTYRLKKSELMPKILKMDRVNISDNELWNADDGGIEPDTTHTPVEKVDYGKK